MLPALKQALLHKRDPESLRGNPDASSVPGTLHPRHTASRRAVLHGACFAALAICTLPSTADNLVRHALAGSYGYDRLVIIYPGDGLTVFDNDGEIDVYVVSMSRRAARTGDRVGNRVGDRVELLLDERPVMPDHDNSFVLRDVTRGSHRLRARIVDSDGRAIAESRPVRFVKWDMQETQANGDRAEE